MLDKEESSRNKMLLVNKINVVFDDEECLLLNLTDYTAFHKFKIEEEKSRLLQTLNTSIYHELLSPLNANVVIA